MFLSAKSIIVVSNSIECLRKYRHMNQNVVAVPGSVSAVRCCMIALWLKFTGHASSSEALPSPVSDWLGSWCGWACVLCVRCVSLCVMVSVTGDGQISGKLRQTEGVKMPQVGSISTSQ